MNIELKKSIATSHIYPPIPDRSHDWVAYFDWDEGGAAMSGHGKSENIAVLDLLEQALEDIEDPQVFDFVKSALLEGWVRMRAEDQPNDR